MNVISSPAKVNLYLLVGGKIPDTGMHLLDSVMAPLELSDEISLEFTESDFSTEALRNGKGATLCTLDHSVSIDRQDLKVRFELVIADELKRVLLVTERLEDTYSELLSKNNLIFKTVISYLTQALELAPELKLPSFLSIMLTKRIPLKAGLGGGSSNAANLLKLLIKSFGVNHRDRIITLARSLGDDVLPCFIGEACHYTDGQTVLLRQCLLAKKLITPELVNGERIRIPVVVLKPDFGIETRKAFAALDRDILDPVSREALKGRATEALVSISDIVSTNIKSKAGTKIFGDSVIGLINDFQNVAEKFYPQLYDARQLIKFVPGKLHCLMTGSGSALIVYFATEQLRDEGAAFMRSRLDESWFCQESYVLI